jgi:hypothetical protein
VNEGGRLSIATTAALEKPVVPAAFTSSATAVKTPSGSGPGRESVQGPAGTWAATVATGEAAPAAPA